MMKNSSKNLNRIQISNDNDPSITRIDGDYSHGTFWVVHFILLFAVFVFFCYIYLFPESLSITNHIINTADTQTITATDIQEGNYSIYLYSILPASKINTKLPINFLINMSIDLIYLDHVDKLTPVQNVTISPQFILNRDISEPFLLYSDVFPKNIKSASFLFKSKSNLIDQFVIEFNSVNPNHVIGDGIWKFFGFMYITTIILYQFIFICKRQPNLLPEFEFLLLFILVLLIDNFPFLILTYWFPKYGIIQESITNSFFRCTILFFLSALASKEQHLSKIPYLILFLMMVIIDLSSIFNKDNLALPIFGVFYLILFIIMLFRALLKYNPEDKIKLYLYILVIVTLQILMFLSRILTLTSIRVNKSHLNSIFPYIARHLFVIIMVYCLEPFGDFFYSKLLL